MVRFTAVILLVLAPLTLTACGALSSNDYTTLMQAICTRTNEATAPDMTLLAQARTQAGAAAGGKDAEAGAAPAAPAAGEVDTLEISDAEQAVLAAKEKQVAQIRELSPPTQSVRSHEQLVTAFEGLTEWKRAGMSAATSKDRPDQPPFTPQDVNRQFRSLGLDVCVSPATAWLASGAKRSTPAP